MYNVYVSLLPLFYDGLIIASSEHVAAFVEAGVKH